MWLLLCVSDRTRLYADFSIAHCHQHITHHRKWLYCFYGSSASDATDLYRRRLSVVIFSAQQPSTCNRNINPHIRFCVTKNPSWLFDVLRSFKYGVRKVKNFIFFRKSLSDIRIILSLSTSRTGILLSWPLFSNSFHPIPRSSSQKKKNHLNHPRNLWPCSRMICCISVSISHLLFIILLFHQPTGLSN